MALEDLTSSPIPTFAITAKLRNSAWLHFAQLLWTGICCSRRQKPPPPIISTARSSSTFSKNASRTPDYTHPRHSSSPDFAFDKAVNSPFITFDTEQVDACSGSSNAGGTSYQNQVCRFLLPLCFGGDGSFLLRWGLWCKPGRSRFVLRTSWCTPGRYWVPLRGCS
jgi:hypothetical protein